MQYSAFTCHAALLCRWKPVEGKQRAKVNTRKSLPHMSWIASCCVRFPTIARYPAGKHMGGGMPRWAVSQRAQCWAPIPFSGWPAAHSPVHPSIHSSIHPSIHSSIHPPIHSSPWLNSSLPSPSSASSIARQSPRLPLTPPPPSPLPLPLPLPCPWIPPHPHPLRGASPLLK